jgi:hypothetical protein
MDFRFFKALPEPDATVVFPSWPDEEAEPDFAVIALERTKDPDANNHTGFDWFGAYGDGDAIDAWADGQPVTAATKAELPNPITFYPAPFTQA